MAWLGGADGVCPYCASGRENLCPNAKFTGWDRDGGFAERITVRADYALRLPDSFSDTEAAPLLCGGIIGYRALKRSGIQPGGSLGLYGFGASASLTIQVARYWGCEVFVRTRSKKDQEEALALGAVDVASYEKPTPAPLDAAVTFAPVGSVVIEALKSLAPGGTVAINAIHLDQMPAFNYDLALGRAQPEQRRQLHPRRRQRVSRACRAHPNQDRHAHLPTRGGQRGARRACRR